MMKRKIFYNGGSPSVRLNKILLEQMNFKSEVGTVLEITYEKERVIITPVKEEKKED